MNKTAFLDKIKSMKMSEFKFVSFIKNVSEREGGEKFTYLKFELETPIEKVMSSLTEFDPNQGKRINELATDVMFVSCDLKVIEDNADDWTFDEDDKGGLTGSGSYGGDLLLDVSRRGECWLTNIKFSKMGNDFRAKGQRERVSKLLEKYARVGVGKKE